MASPLPAAQRRFSSAVLEKAPSFDPAPGLASWAVAAEPSDADPSSGGHMLRQTQQAPTAKPGSKPIAETRQ